MPVILNNFREIFPEVSVSQCFAAQWVANYKNPEVVFKVIMCL